MIPLVLNSPEPMLKVRVVTAKDYSNRALKTLHRVGVLHVEQSTELRPIDREAIEHERREVEELLTAIDDVLAYIPQGERVPLGEDIEVIYTRPFDETDSEVRRLCTKLSNMHQRVAKLSKEVEKLTELSKYLGPLEQQTDIRLKDLSFSGSYLFSRIFVLTNEVYETLHRKLENYLFGGIVATTENETIFYAISKVSDQGIIESTIKDGGGKTLQIPDEDSTLKEFLKVVGDRIHGLGEGLTELSREIEVKTRENLEKLVLFRGALSAENERLSVLEKACEAKYVTLIEGWIPDSKIETAIYEIKDSVDYVFIDTREPTTQEEPPTNLKNPRVMKPFEVITNLFGSPKYREGDPTPIMAYSFAIFFGLMLCDVVYAIGVILVTRFVLRIFVDDPNTEGYRLFQRVLYTSSIVALILGLLTGTYLGDAYLFFGIENLALAEPIKQLLGDPITFIILAIALGVIHVNTAHVLALIRGVKERKKSVVISKVGIFTLQFFGIPLVLLWLFNVSLPVSAGVYSIFMYIVFASVALIVVSAFMQRGSLGAIFWLFDLTGLLGDIMSYCRLAGVGLATFYLASSFNMLAQLLYDMMPGVAGVIIGGILAFLVLAFGHAINLALSGLTAFIHSLRLCFVEFLFKFYEGGGIEYSPFRLKSPVPVLVGRK